MSRSPMVQTPALDLVTAELDSLLLNARSTLPRSGNNQPIPPSSQYAANVAKGITQGTCVPNRMIAALLATNGRDGADIEKSRLYVRRLDALVEVTHRRPTLSLSPLSPLNRRETRAQCATDLAQLAAEASQGNCQDALRSVIEGSTAQIAALEEVRRWAEMRITALQLGEACPTLALVR